MDVSESEIPMIYDVFLDIKGGQRVPKMTQRKMDHGFKLIRPLSAIFYNPLSAEMVNESQESRPVARSSVWFNGTPPLYFADWTLSNHLVPNRVVKSSDTKNRKLSVAIIIAMPSNRLHGGRPRIPETGETYLPELAVGCTESTWIHGDDM
ncbi:hypothetical protein FRB94_003204 [Tulasnella sp. JGI-2019a]|nr:hypothetical protein FRB94_003204 [Tulasnella sp. JGI-2019a]